jgi:V-type H+-transporting ATPase subunit C
MSHPSSQWFISAPADRTKQETIEKLSTAFKKNEYAEIFPFVIPDFKVGTLNSLMVLSDELVKADNTLEAIVLKISETLKSLLKNDVEQWKQYLLVADSI